MTAGTALRCKRRGNGSVHPNGWLNCHGYHTATEIGTRIALSYDLPERRTEEVMPPGNRFRFTWRGDEITGVDPQATWRPFYPRKESEA